MSSVPPQYPQQYPPYYPQQFPPQPQNPPTANGFAIASLVLGILGGILLSVIFGIVGLVQIKRNGQRGKGLAISGLVLSGVWTVLFCLIGVFLIANGSWSDAVTPAATTPSDTVRWDQLKEGQCVNGLSDASSSRVYRLPLVPCSGPHEGEVYLTDEVLEDTYPGKDTMIEQADQACAESLDDKFPDLPDDLTIEIMYVYPTDVSFRQGDRQITCLAYSSDMLTGPLAEL